MYTYQADWSLIGELKADPRMEIPIIGNGDVTTPEEAAAAFRDYGVDGIMIGRGSIGAPWVFHDVLQYLREGEWSPLSVSEKFGLLRRQIRESIDRIDEYRGFSIFAVILRRPRSLKAFLISGRRG